jgi:hypothetical protein
VVEAGRALVFSTTTVQIWEQAELQRGHLTWHQHLHDHKRVHGHPHLPLCMVLRVAVVAHMRVCVGRRHGMLLQGPQQPASHNTLGRVLYIRSSSSSSSSISSRLRV